jgi:hypothetical protein
LLLLFFNVPYKRAAQAAPALRRGLRFFGSPLSGRQAPQAALFKVAAAALSFFIYFCYRKN